jgi:Tol biopolymer transport system component
VSEDSLSQSISALRRALGDDPNQPEYVATVPRRGYRFVAPVVDVREAAAAPAALPVEAPPRPITPAAPARVAAPRRSPTAAGVWALMVMAAMAGALIGSRFLPAGADAVSVGPVRFTLDPPAGTTLQSGGILSPDNRHVVFAAEDEGGDTRLWVKAFNAADARALPGTEGGLKPFWSPDGRSIAFFGGGSLKRVGLSGDPPQTITNVGLSPGGGSWGPSGNILYAGWRTGIYLVPASGGTPRLVTTLDPAAQEGAHTSPQFLPDGRHFLFHVLAADRAKSGTYAASLDSRDRVRLLDVDGVSFVAPSYLVYVRERALLAHPFNLETLALEGQPQMLVGNVGAPGTGGAISASPAGLLSFGGGTSGSRMVWFTRAGQVQDAIEVPITLHNAAFSRDGTQLLASGGGGVWAVDLARNAAARLSDAGTSPFASPDGRQVAFTSDRNGGISHIYLRTQGSDRDELLLETPENKIVNDWTRDGRYVVFVTTNARTSKDIWLLPMAGEARTPQSFLVTPFNEIQAQVSPDGRWIAYASDESGRWEVYVQSFPVAGNKRVVSVGGGAEPQWRRDGRELYYLSTTRRLMAVALDLAGPGRIGAPSTLFRAPVWGELNSYRSHFLAAPDGQRFLVDAVEPENSRDPVTVVVNWRELLVD